MESMGVASGCGYKEVYRFPHITYPYSSCLCSFLQQHPYFLFIFKMFFVLYVYGIRAHHSAAAAVPVITEGSSVPPGQRERR